jgi:SAM-dependent methyltransferase
MYVEYWERLVDKDEYATFSTPPEWSQRFDAVLSFFALEHVAEPTQVVAEMHALLRPGGSLYIVVPNFEVNIADMVVVDHVNHFSGPSLERLLVDGGFEQVVLNATAHHGAWIAIARRSDGAEGPPVASQSIEAAAARSREIAGYWGTVDAHLSAAEAEIDERPTAIYGAGFYGSLIHTRLTTTDHVVAFVDQNPFLQGREHLGRPVVAPPDLPPEVTHVLVGLNPLGAAKVIGAIDVWRDRSLDFHYL